MRGLSLDPSKLRRQSRRHLMPLAFVLVAALPVGLLTYSAVALSSDAVSSEAEQGASGIAAASGNTIAQQYANVTQWLSAYADLRLVGLNVRGQWDQTALGVELSRLIQSQQGINAAVLFDASDQEVVGYPLDFSLGAQQFEHDWYPIVSTRGSPDVVTIRSGSSVNPTGVAIAIEVPQNGVPGARPIGFLVAVTYLTQTERFVQAYARTRGITLTVVDATGAVLASPDLPRATSAPGLSQQQRALLRHAGVLVRSGPQGEVFTASSPIQGLGWTMLADVPAADAEGDISRLRTTVFTVGIVFTLVLALGLLGGLMLTRRAQQAGELHSRVRSLRWLDEAAQSMHNLQDQSIVCDTIVATARVMSDARMTQLALFEPESATEFVTVASSRADGWDLGHPGLLATLLEAAQPESRSIRLATFSTPADEPGADADRLGPVLAIRLEAGDEVLGWLVAARSPSGESFDEEDEALLRQLCQHGATAIQRIRYEESLNLKNDELANANQLKSEFLAKMSHELRTPLSAIIGFSELILDGADGTISAELADDVGQINRSGKSLLDLINDILDLSKIESGRMVFEIESVALPDLVEDVISSTRPLAESRDLRISAEIEGSRGSLTASCDAVRTRQVVTNLVANAIKFTPQGSVTIRCRPAGGDVEISVEDTGIGIDPDAHSRIFEEFVQADGSTTRKFGGTGLGLSISRRLIELQGGHLGLESEPGTGSRFWFVLPGVKEGEAHPGAAFHSPRVRIGAPVRG